MSPERANHHHDVSVTDKEFELTRFARYEGSAQLNVRPIKETEIETYR